LNKIYVQLHKNSHHRQEAFFTANILVICDSELEYAYHLMEALGRREDLDCEIRVFSGADKLCCHMADTPVSVLLVAESAYSKEIEKLSIERIVILQEGKDPPRAEQGIDEKYPAISKYSSVSSIVRMAMEGTILSGMSGRHSTHQTPVRLIGIYTPVRRCLQTTFAFVTGQILARSHRVLYLNFETYSGLGTMFDRSFSAELTDLLYFLNASPQKLLAKLYQMVENINGMDMCPPAFCGTDISQLKEEEWMKFLDVLEESRYEYILLDLSDAVQGLYEILRRCRRVYTITREDGFAMAKIDQYEKVLKMAAYEDVLKKTKKLPLPLFKKLPRSLYHMTTGELAEYAERMLKEDETGIL